MADKNVFKDKILNCIPSKGVENDWILADAVDAELLAAPPSIPEEKDLREDWWTINDQESTGSCVGWATADSVLRWHLVKAGRLQAEKHDLLSTRFIWMAAKETDEFESRPTTFIEVAGTSLKAALDVTRKFGCVKDSTLPFAPSTLYQGRPPMFYAIASQFRIGGYFNLGREPQEWKSWLANNGPILTRLNVDTPWYKATENNGYLDKYEPHTAGGGHAIALVGYNKDGFIVRNSWGTHWGHEGFAYASESYARDAFTEAYGISL